MLLAALTIEGHGMGKSQMRTDPGMAIPLENGDICTCRQSPFSVVSMSGSACSPLQPKHSKNKKGEELEQVELSGICIGAP